LYNPVKYKYAATTNAAATFELDEPWQGPTGYVIDGTTEATNCGTATLTSDTWGLKFTGVEQPFIALTDNTTIVEFDVLSEELTATTEYKAVKATKGSGSWREVAFLEGYAQGNDRFYYANDMIQGRTFDAVAGKAYDIITLVVHTQPYVSTTTGNAPINKCTLVLALDTSISYDTLNTAFGLTAV